ncbi:RNA-binding protein Luc7-like 2, partial [Tremellales sp. Uapishka_1]
MGKMAEVQKRLLEQMMGPEAMGIQPINVDWWNEKVCRNFLFGTCPHLIFGNTKMDLGPCPKIHSDRILKQFTDARTAAPNDPRILAFKQEHENSIYGFVDDCDRRIRGSQRKLEKTPEENKKTVDLMREIGEIELSIQGGTEEIEALGEAGKIDESMAKLGAVDALKREKSDKERELTTLNENAGASGHQKLRVCETCGAMLSVLDSDKRLADHFGGKMHLGYNELRKLISQFAEDRMTARNNPPPPQHQQQSRPPPPPFNAPSGPASSAVPQTPSHHPKIPPAEEMPVVGHGDKVKREAGELVEDVKDLQAKSERDRERDGRSSRYDHREDKYDHRDREDKYDRRDRYDERERSDRGHGRERERERERKYDDRSDRHRSRSPQKRRLV